MANIGQGGTEVYTIKKARKNGKKDGRRWAWNGKPPFWPLVVEKPPIPGDSDTKPSDYETVLVGLFQQDINNVSNAWSKEDQSLLPEYCRAKADHDMKVGQLGREDQEKVEAATEFQRLREDFMNFPPPWLDPKVYWAIFGVIVAAEGFFNFSVFRLFGRADFESWLIAGGIVVILPVAAEVIGHHLKAEKKTRGGMIGSAVVLFILTALFVALAVLRDKFLQTNEETRLPIDESTLVFILIVFNIAIFAVMTFLAYTQARPNSEEYTTARNKYKDALRNVDTQTGDANIAEKNLADARERLAAARAKRECELSAHQEKASSLIETCGILVSEYRGANMAARNVGAKSASRPPCFNDNPRELLKMPANLTSIEWICKDQQAVEMRPIPVTAPDHSTSTNPVGASEKAGS